MVITKTTGNAKKTKRVLRSAPKRTLDAVAEFETEQEKKRTENKVHIVIQPLMLRIAKNKLVGDSWLVMNKFSNRKRQGIHDSQKEGSKQAGKKKGKAPKDFKRDYEESMHKSEEGWVGIPANAFRHALIRACKLTEIEMTQAKQAIFIVADGFDATDGTPLVKITKGKPSYFESIVRNATGVVDIRARARWKPGWECWLNVEFDSEVFTIAEVANLVYRAGRTIGVLEGRPFSKKSAGMGWGTWNTLATEEYEVKH